MLKKILSIMLLFSSLALFVSCKDEVTEPEYYSASFFAMDTEVTVRLARNSGNLDDDENPVYFEDSVLSDIVKKCSNIAEEKEALLSRTDAKSALSELNKEADFFLKVDPELLGLIETAREISDKTDGAFDVTVGNITELWNVTGDAPSVPSDEDVAEALSHTGNDKIVTDGVSIRKTDRKTKFDLGAIGKGYALGKIIEYLNTTDVKYGVVSFGGNVGVFGKKAEGASFKVGITDAANTDAVSGYVYVDSGYVSVSGDYERYFEADGKKYAHIFDPSTGRPAESDISGVALICEDPSLADALSTAMYVKGSEKTLEFYSSGTYKFEAVIQKKDGTLVLTDGLKNGVFEKYVESAESTED